MSVSVSVFYKLGKQMRVHVYYVSLFHLYNTYSAYAYYKVSPWNNNKNMYWND